MKLFLFLIFSSFFMAFGYSQTLNSSLTQETAGKNYGLRSFSSDALADDVFKKRTINKKLGSVYLFESWQRTALITSEKGNKIELRTINFNIEENRFETEINSDSTFIFNNDELKSVQILGASYNKMNDPKTNETLFFESLLVSDNISVYKRPELVISRGVLNPLTQEKEPDVMSKRMLYFYSKNNSKLVEFDLKKKSILKEFSNKKNELDNFVKQNKLDYASEKDVIEMLTYYNFL